MNRESAEKPKVSIIMATYNRGKFIAESVESILNQSYTNWELFIIDDGGTDNTKEVLLPYLRDERILFLERGAKHKKGLPGCRNFGLEKAKGDFVIFFDDDDIVHPDNLKLCVNALHNSSYDFCRYIREVFTGKFDKVFNRENEFSSFEITVNDLEKMIDGTLPFNSCAVMWRKEIFNEERFNEDLMYAEEWELYSRILAGGAKGISINKTLFFGRKHPHSNTGEFWNNNPTRRASKIKAVKLVIDNLKQKQMLSNSLAKFFIQLGFFLKDASIVSYILQKSDAGVWTKIKYNWGYKIYPILRPIFKLKAKLTSC